MMPASATQGGHKQCLLVNCASDDVSSGVAVADGTGHWAPAWY